MEVVIPRGAAVSMTDVAISMRLLPDQAWVLRWIKPFLARRRQFTVVSFVEVTLGWRAFYCSCLFSVDATMDGYLLFSSQP
jgi:hypothetical protein